MLLCQNIDVLNLFKSIILNALIKQIIPMKKLIISIALTFMLGVGFAQMSSSEQALIKSVFNTEKKMLVQEQMNLTEEHAKLFWPIYEKYETENGQLDDKSGAMRSIMGS